MVDTALASARSNGFEHLRVASVSALDLTRTYVLAAAGYLLATPANLFHTSGALKYTIDTTFGAINATQGRPYGALVHSESCTA